MSGDEGEKRARVVDIKQNKTGLSTHRSIHPYLQKDSSFTSQTESVDTFVLLSNM